MNIYESENKIIIENLNFFDLSDTFECGQCFRFNKINNQTKEDWFDCFDGVAFGKYLRITKESDKIYLETSLEDFNNIWRGFFDIDRNYKKIFDFLRHDEILKQASDFCPGIRILRQEPFECLISFIISQNNNIPRIKKIIERLCENFGEKIIYADKHYYAFPSAEKIAGLKPEDLDIIKSGFRAKYIHEAAERIASGEINLDFIFDLNADDGLEYLKQLKGVGNKVASCVLLYAYNKLESFPVDVWIKRVTEKYYPVDFDYKKTFGEYAGLANAYLFYYERKK